MSTKKGRTKKGRTKKGRTKKGRTKKGETTNWFLQNKKKLLIIILFIILIIIGIILYYVLNNNNKSNEKKKFIKKYGDKLKTSISNSHDMKFQNNLESIINNYNKGYLYLLYYDYKKDWNINKLIYLTNFDNIQTIKNLGDNVSKNKEYKIIDNHIKYKRIDTLSKRIMVFVQIHNDTIKYLGYYLCKKEGKYCLKWNE